MVAGFVSVGLLFPLALSYVIPLVLLLIIGQLIVSSKYKELGNLEGKIYQLRSNTLLTTFSNYLMIKRNDFSLKYRKFYKKNLLDIQKKEVRMSKIIVLILLINVGVSGIFSGISAIVTVSIAVQHGSVTFGVVLGIINISIAVFKDSIQTIQNISSIIRGKELLENLTSSLVFKYFKAKEISNYETITLETKNKLSIQTKLKINKGDKILFEGSNGSGKSSLLEFFSGNNFNDNILLKINNMDFSNEKVFNMDQLTYLCTNLHYFEDLNLKNNLIFNLDKEAKPTETQNIEKIEIMKQLVEEFQLTHLDLSKDIDNKSMTYSEGEKQRIQIIRAILSDKQILIFDESLANIHSDLRDVIYNYLLIKEKRTVLLVSHDFDKQKYEKLINKTFSTDLFNVFENKEVANA